MPLSPARIKFLIEEMGESQASLANRWGYRPQEVSYCIRREPGRVYPRLRLLISEFLGRPVDSVFGPHPLTTAMLKHREDRQRSAA